MKPAPHNATHEILPQIKTADDRDFVRIASVSTAIGLGFMAGAIQSLRNANGFYFSLTIWTLLACGIGAAAGLLCWKLMRIGPRAARVATTLLVVVGFGGFLYPLRFVSHDRLPEITKGLIVAACVISLGAALLWQLKRSLEYEDARN